MRMAFRDDLQALQARHEALETEVTVKQRERDAVRGMLDEAKTRARLPVLDNLRVAAPCNADWSQMTPGADDRVRNCGDCKKDVYNLTDMTRDEAEALIVATAGKLCVRYFQRHDGTILLADCVVGAKRRRRRKLVMIAGATALLATGGVAAYKKLAHQQEEEMVMGRMQVRETQEVTGQVQAEPAQPGHFVMGNK
jgi:hypothetical protein